MKQSVEQHRNRNSMQFIYVSDVFLVITGGVQMHAEIDKPRANMYG